MQKKWDRREILQLLALPVTLAGLSITALTIFKNKAQINVSDQRFHLRHIVALASRQDETKCLSQTFNANVNFGCQFPTRMPKSLSPFFSSTSGMLVRSHYSTVQIHFLKICIFS